MKLKDFEFYQAWKDWFFILPTIVIQLEPHYIPSLYSSIAFHWLGFHLRWRFVRRNKEDKT